MTDSLSPLPAQQLGCQTSESASVLAGNPGHLLRPAEGHCGGGGCDFPPASLHIISSSDSLGSAIWLLGHAVPCCHHEPCLGKRRGAIYIYVSDVIKFLKLFAVTSELCGVKCVGSGGWRDRMWQSCRVSNKARCLVFMGKMIYAPHQQCQFMDFSGLSGEIGKIHL